MAQSYWELQEVIQQVFSPLTQGDAEEHGVLRLTEEGEAWVRRERIVERLCEAMWVTTPSDMK